MGTRKSAVRKIPAVALNDDEDGAAMSEQLDERIGTFVEKFTQETLRFDCDKVIDHDYARFYAEVFSSITTAQPRLLEIGVGGYDDPQSGGASTEVWRQLLPDWSIVAIDIAKKTFSFPKGVMFITADQTDAGHLEHIGSVYGPFDVIIDDGSHCNSAVRQALHGLFPYLNDGGCYVIEDTQTSYLERYGGGLSRELASTANLAREMFDYANCAELPLDTPIPEPFKNTVGEVRFRHNIMSIRKEVVTRYSNLSIEGKRSMLETGRKVLSADAHGAGFWLRQARYLLALGRPSEAHGLLAEGHVAWPDDREISSALARLRAGRDDEGSAS